MKLDKTQIARQITRDAARTAAAARQGVTAAVPSCPGWTVADLLVHLGGVQRFWAHTIRQRAAEPQPFPRQEYDAVPGLFEWVSADEGTLDPSTLPPGTIEWLQQGAAHLAQAIVESDANDAAWHWSGDNRAISSWRMQLVEASLHRWDAQLAHGTPEPIEPEVAAAGVEHFFDVILPQRRRSGKPARGAGERYLFRQEDGPTWRVTFRGGDATVTKGTGTADVTVQGTAEELLLWLWGRLPSEQLAISGKRALLERWLELVPPLQ